jgi:phosphoglucosamine mutase
MTMFPQTMINVPVAPGRDWQTSSPVTDACAAAQTALGRSGRLLIRASGTEPVVRVMVEAEDALLAKRTAESVAQVVQHHCG